MHSQLVVLGGGPGGYAAAFLAADLGMQVTLVDAEDRLGGTCLLRGCIPSKALLHVARVIGETQELKDEWGVAFNKPKINLDKLRARKDQVITTLTGGLAGLARKRKVKVIQARGAFENSTTLRLEGPGAKEDPVLTFDHCILATGSTAAMPAFLQIGSPRIMDSTGALDLPEIPESLLVIGGGYIGLEMGTVYARLGTKVSVVELLDSLLSGADPDLVKPLHKGLEALFERIDLKTKVTGVKDTGKAVEVMLQGPEKVESRRFDRVLVAVGRQPNSRALGLENTQVQLDAKGFVLVDERRRTADEHILAIGDVAGEPMLAHKASHEGRIAVEALHGAPAAWDKRAVPAVVFTDPEIAWAGLTEAQAKAQGRKVEVAQYPWAASGRAQAMTRTEGLTKMIVDPETEQVLGVGIVGNGAGEMIAEAVLAIEMACTVRDVTDSIHPHPTMSETVGNAGEAYFGLATEIYRPRKERTPQA